MNYTFLADLITNNGKVDKSQRNTDTWVKMKNDFSWLIRQYLILFGYFISAGISFQNNKNRKIYRKEYCCFKFPPTKLVFLIFNDQKINNKWGIFKPYRKIGTSELNTKYLNQKMLVLQNGPKEKTSLG